MESLARAGDDRGPVLGVHRRFLGRHDVRNLRQPQRRLDRHVHAGARRHVVEHDRQLHAFGDRLEVLIQAFLRRLVVVRRDREQPVGADAFHVARQLDHLARVVAARAGEHRHAAVGLFDDQLHDAQLVAMAQRRRFPRRPAGGEEVDAGVDLSSGQALDGGLVEGAVLGERRNQCGADARESRTHFCPSSIRVGVRLRRSSPGSDPITLPTRPASNTSRCVP